MPILFFRCLSLLRRDLRNLFRKSLDPSISRSLSETGATFSSLVPTHYIMMLGLPAAVRGRCKVDQISKLTRLFCAGSTRHQSRDHGILQELRIVRIIRLDRGWLGDHASSGRAVQQTRFRGPRMRGGGTDRDLDRDGNEVPDGEPGELYSNNPYTFDGYWKLPEKTKDAFRGEYCSVGDMARRDEDGYIFLVDRKSNMIISGGENVYPSEVENMLGGNPKNPRGRGHRAPDAKMGRARARRDHPCSGHGGDRAGVADVVFRQDRRLQTPAVHFVYRRSRDAAHGHRQDPAPAVAKQTGAERRLMEPPMAKTAKSVDLNADENACSAWIARFLKQRGVDRISVCKAATFSQSGITSHGKVSASSTSAMRARPSTWHTRMPN